MKKAFLLIGCLIFGLSHLQAQIEEIEGIDHPRSSEYAITIHPSGSPIVYQSDRNQDWLLYVSYRSRQGLTDPVPVYQNLPVGAFLGGPCFSADGQTLVFFSDIDGNLDLYRASYDQKTHQFGEAQAFPAPVNSSNYEAFPTISPDGQVLVFVTDLPADSLSSSVEAEGWEEEEVESPSCYRLMASVRKESGEWGEPHPLMFDELACVGFPRIMPDGETLTFSAWTETGKFDLYRCRFEVDRAEARIRLGAPSAISTLNSGEDDKMLSATYTGSTLVFSRAEPIDSWEEPDMAMRAPGALLPDVAGWAYIRVKVATETGTPVESGLIVRAGRNEAPVLPDLGTGEDGETIFRLRAGQQYQVSASAPAHDFATVAVDLRRVFAPDTILTAITLNPLDKEVTIRLDNLTFEYNSAEINDTASAILGIAARFLTENEGVKVEIAAHTDSIGSPEFNLDLSQRRANAVVEALVSRGASRDRLIPKGYGESSPLADNDTEEGRALNRRVEFRILEE